MRINKHSRPWAMAGRRLFRERLKNQNAEESTISEAGNTLLEKKPEPSASPFTASQPLMSADPTQRLLTILGRFNRLVSLAEAGNAQDTWCDDCMEQLINGIEIALNESWTDVKQALTDTARVLQSYEDAGLPASALPYLKRSYEVMCLMVGDLIVGNVRSGVIEKWRASYTEAVTDLRRAGIPLVDDGGGHQQAAIKSGDVNETSQDAAETEVQETETVIDEQEVTEPEVDLEPANALDSATQTDNAQADPAFADLPFDMPGEFESVSDASPSDGLYMEFQPEISDAGIIGTHETEDRTEPVEHAEASDEAVTEADAEDFEKVSVADESQSQEKDKLTDEAVDEVTSDSELDAPPIQDDVSDVADTHPAITAMDAAQDEKESPEIDASQEGVEVNAELEDTVEEKPEEENPIQILLRSAGLAIEKGDVSEAKIVALQLAAKMASLEEERALERVSVTSAAMEALLSEIRDGESVVEQAQAHVNTNQETIQQHTQGIQDTKSEIENLQRQVASVETRMTDLDEQIRILQEKRADEAQIGAELQADMEMAIYREGQLKDELTNLQDAEQGARTALIAAELHVARLYEHRDRQEALIAEADAEVTRQRKSLADIQHTINLVLGIAVTEEPVVEDTPADTVEDTVEGVSVDSEPENTAPDETTDTIEDEIIQDEPVQDSAPTVEDTETTDVVEQTTADSEQEIVESESEVEAETETEATADDEQRVSDETQDANWENNIENPRENSSDGEYSEDNEFSCEEDYHRDQDAAYDDDDDCASHEDAYVSDWGQNDDEAMRDTANSTGLEASHLLSDGEQQELF